MVTKYEFYYTNDFGDEYPAFCRENPKEPYGETYVLATDYAALEAERDEWKRRCEAMVGELHTAMIHSNPELVSKHMMAALAIAEGRDE